MNGWTKDEEWHGNPKLGYDSWHKVFKNHLKGNRKTKVYVFGKDEHWRFCVDDGPNGDFSYTGYRPDCPTAQALMNRIDNPEPGDQALFH